MDKEDEIHIYDGILLCHKKEIIPFSEIWMDLETIILSEVSERQTSYDNTYMWNLKKKKKDTNELI